MITTAATLKYDKNEVHDLEEKVETQNRCTISMLNKNILFLFKIWMSILIVQHLDLAGT